MAPENRAWLAVAVMLVVGVWLYVLNDLVLSISWWWAAGGA